MLNDCGHGCNQWLQRRSKPSRRTPVLRNQLFASYCVQSRNTLWTEKIASVRDRLERRQRRVNHESENASECGGANLITINCAGSSRRTTCGHNVPGVAQRSNCDERRGDDERSGEQREWSSHRHYEFVDHGTSSWCDEHVRDYLKDDFQRGSQSHDGRGSNFWRARRYTSIAVERTNCRPDQYPTSRTRRKSNRRERSPNHDR